MAQERQEDPPRGLTIEREEVLGREDPSFLLLFDRYIERLGKTEGPKLWFHPERTLGGSLHFPKGWQHPNTKELLETSPRLLLLLAKHGLVPLEEVDVLRLIMDAGVALERLPMPVADVQHLDISASKSLLLFHLSKRKARTFIPKEEAPAARVVVIGGEP